MDKFYAGTEYEIQNSSRKVMQRFHLKYLLIHHGAFQILKNGILLENWRLINWDMIRKVTLENDANISANMFATQNRLFFLKSARPIKLVLMNGEVIYLYVNWHFSTGLSANTKIYENIKKNKIKT